VSAPGEARAPGVLRLAGLLAGVRWRSLAGRLLRGPRPGVTLVAGLLGLLLPVAYVGLFAVAFAEIGRAGGPAAEAAALALVAGALAASSLAAKAAAGDLVMGAGGEVEFLLARPVGLPALVVARGLAGLVTDLFDALFLLPVLAAAGLALGLGGGAVALAVLSSLLVQVAVTALGAAVQIAVVALCPRRRRRLAWTLLALLAAAGMAGLWMAGTTVLRSPAAAAQLVTGHAGWLRFTPGGLAAAPQLALRAGDGAGALLALLALAGQAAAALAVAWAAARLGGRRGWEQAGAPWTEGDARPPAAPGPPPGLWRKDWLLIARDRPRLVALLGLPAVFVGVQVFGSAGWGWSTQDPAHVALVAYSLAVYAATVGPLRHMEAERGAFWILLGTPVSGARLLGARAGFWAVVVAGVAASVYLLLAGLAGGQMSLAGLAVHGLAAVIGAALAAVLAVGLGAEAAELGDDAAGGRRGAPGLATGYLFMLAAGLYNVALLMAERQPAAAARALALYALAAGTAFAAGADRVMRAFDAAGGRRAVSPVTGALLAILLYLGGRAVAAAAQSLGAGAEVQPVFTAWTALVGVAAAASWLRGRHAPPRGGWPRAALVLAAGALAAALFVTTCCPAPGCCGDAGWPLARVLVPALAGELVVRGLLQAGLEQVGSPARVGRARRVGAALASACAAWAASPAAAGPLGPAATAAAAVLPAGAFALTGRLGIAIAVRLTLFVAAGH
jgi:hypothetical protein